jgi:hypothetical protein
MDQCVEQTREEHARRNMASELNETEEKMLRMMGLTDRLATLVLGGMDDGIPAPMPADLRSFIKVLNTHLEEAISRLSSVVDVLVAVLPSKTETRMLTEADLPRRRSASPGGFDSMFDNHMGIAMEREQERKWREEGKIK